MRILGIGEDGDLGDMYARLGRDGHDVRMYAAAPEAKGIYAGIVPHSADWQSELPWIRSAGREGVIVFETATYGAVQDQLRSEGYQVIGGSAFGDRLEADRAFGQGQLKGSGLRSAGCRAFTDFDAALAFLRAHPRRYVLKSNGANTLRTRNFIGQMDSGADMTALLTTYRRQWKSETRPDFVLMDYVQGVEVGVGAYFDGQRFLEPACLDWEHKRLFSGDLGELTGEMGTIVTYRGAERIFSLTLAPLCDVLRQSGYCGYINLNLMANDEGLWPIEFTTRFGYPGYAICEALHHESWASIFRKLLGGDAVSIDTAPGYAAGVVLAVPPFPYRYGYDELSRGLPISFRDTLTDSDRDALHFAEVAMQDGQLVTSGMIGYVGVATGTGPSVDVARDRAYALSRKVVVPNLRYRVDIGDRVIDHDLTELVRLGYLDPDVTTLE